MDARGIVLCTTLLMCACGASHNSGSDGKGDQTPPNSSGMSRGDAGDHQNRADGSTSTASKSPDPGAGAGGGHGGMGSSSTGADAGSSDPTSGMDASAGAGGNNAHDSGMMSQSCSGSCDDNIDCTIDECVSGECSHRVDSSSCGADKVCDPAKGCVTMAGTQEICDGMDNDGDNKIDEDPAASDSCGGGQCTNGACSGCTSNSDRDGLEQLYPYAIGPNTQNSVWTVAGWCVNLNSTSVSKQRACLDAVVEDSLSSRCRQCLYHYQECYGPCGCFATTPPAEPCKCIEKYEECSGVPSGMTCN